MDDKNLKKLKQYSNAALFSAILAVIFGFGLGFIGLAFPAVAAILAIAGLVKNKENIRNIKVKCIIAIVIVLVTIGLSFIGFTGLISFVINPSTMNWVDEITKPLFK